MTEREDSGALGEAAQMQCPPGGTQADSSRGWSWFTESRSMASLLLLNKHLTFPGQLHNLQLCLWLAWPSNWNSDPSQSLGIHPKVIQMSIEGVALANRRPYQGVQKCILLNGAHCALITCSGTVIDIGNEQ